MNRGQIGTGMRKETETRCEMWRECNNRRLVYSKEKTKVEKLKTCCSVCQGRRVWKVSSHFQMTREKFIVLGPGCQILSTDGHQQLGLPCRKWRAASLLAARLYGVWSPSSLFCAVHRSSLFTLSPPTLKEHTLSHFLPQRDV